ncbi:glycosyltransferase family 9 protein [Verrucomicrobium sp. BvORR106]|uniref:glycosyltransferase family 9 protein n=1 Tax=Verrucomicrobium sp. BvORR106 TaxID=1403819 RepID=UPI0009DE0C58|nr:glycosyltransferase family 9 protein [Verrucomicrobium sp. BvORR106]
MMVEPLPDLAQYKSVFLVKPSSLGDIVHTLPAARFLKKTHPELLIRWVCNPEWMPLLEGNPDISEVIPFPRSQFGRISTFPKLFSWARSLHTSTREQPEIALDFQGLLRSALICQVRGVKPIVGLSDAREGATFFYKHVVEVDSKAHAVDRYLTLVNALGIPTPAEEITFTLPVGTAPANAPKEGTFLVLHPYSRGDGKSLTTEAIQALCDCLAPHPVVLAGKYANPPQIHGNHVTSLLNRTTLEELIWLLRHSHACVSVDSGPMHMAAALQERTLAIHTWSNPRQVGPYNAKARVWKGGRIAQRLDFSEEEGAGNQAVAIRDIRRISDFILGEWY